VDEYPEFGILEPFGDGTFLERFPVGLVFLGIKGY